MNTQPRLSDLDRVKHANLKLRQQLLNNEVETFFRDVFATYGNPGEQLGVADDGTLVRQPDPAAQPAGPADPARLAATPPAEKRKKAAK
jgi:hypothetical protein